MMRTHATALVTTLVWIATVLPARAQTAPECVRAADAGQEQRAQGKLRAARASFVSCASEQCALVIRKDCARWLDEVDADTPTVVFGAKDADGRDVSDISVSVDGRAEPNATSGMAIALDPGPHEVHFERPRAPPVVEHIVLRMGERNRSVVAVFARPAPPAERVPAPQPPTLSPLVYVFGGLGLAAIGSFAYFGVTGLEKKDALRTSCAPSCTDADVSPVRARYIDADVSLAVGVVAIAAAAWLALSSGPPAARHPATSGTARIELTPTGARLRF